MTLQWTFTAEEDLEDILEYIAFNDGISRAEDIGLLILEKAEKIKAYPDKGRLVPELKSISVLAYREKIISPWRIVYRFHESEVYVVSVLDGRRDLRRLIEQRWDRGLL
ncbi:MAG: type II toxin-antitoxin system RelE/ParE family toxin [Planctomycetes bacterium]|nr:type II toxin-antitoxin system RelE/ParE family toxin [Planctomycetota bacterium]